MVYEPILGAGTSQCVPQDVSGSQRHLFFSSQSTFSHSERQFVFQNDSESNDKSLNEPLFTNHSTQTSDDEYWKAKRVQKILLGIRCKEQDIANRANMRRRQHQENKRKEELLLPPVTDKESLMTYRLFLEEHEKKEFMIREEELEERMKLKFDMITKSLHARYRKGDTKHEQRIEAMRVRKRSKHSKRKNCSQKLKVNQSNGKADILQVERTFKEERSIEKETKRFNKTDQKKPSTRERVQHLKSLELLHSKLN